MLLNRQFNLLIGTAGVVLAVALGATFMALEQVRAQTGRVAQAQATARGVANFRYLTMETLLYGEARSRRQWRLRVASFGQILSQHSYTLEDERALLAREKANLVVIDRLFSQLDGKPYSSDDRRTSAIISALFVTSQEMLDDALDLINLNQRDLEVAQQRATRIILLSIVVLVMLIAVAAFLVKRRVLVPVAALQAVTEHVSQGDLSARVNFFTPDELGKLGRTFDGMTALLEQSHLEMRRENAERRAAQEALGQAQADLQSILDHTPALVVYWDRDLKNRFANRSCSDWFGMTPEQMRGRHIADVIGAAQYGAMAARLDSVLAGNSELFEESIVLPTGERRDVLFSYMPDVRSDQIVGLYGVISDVTPMRRAEAGQARALRKLQNVLKAASDFSIIQTDLSGTIELFSPGAERMLGYAATDMVLKRHPGILHLEQEIHAYGAALSERYGREIAGFEVFVAEAREGASVSRDWTYVRRDGSQLPVNLTVTAIRDEFGEIDGYLGIAKDVSAERDIRRNLAAARDQAEQANHGKSQFLATMSHEIRTPMNAVLGMLELLQYTPLSQLQRDYADKSHSAARSLLDLLNDILDFSQVEANRIEIESAPFSLETLLRDLSTILSSLVGEKDVEVLFSVDPALPQWLQGDVTRVRQVLINLASNALKFTDHGEVMIMLGLRCCSAQGVEIEFQVRDTGIGIAADKLERIFDGFTQAEASTTRRFGGTGLGLTISQSLVGLMGGNLRVDSVLGAGSCFSFCLPFVPAADPQPALLPAPRDTPQGLRVLIVDDSAPARLVIGAIVAALGWSAVTVDSGELALRALDEAALAQSLFDVVLLDWRMPGMDGWELASRIRAISGGPPTVLMVTAHGRGALAERIESRRGLLSGFLIKPVTPLMLCEAVIAALGGQVFEAAPQQRQARSKRLTDLRVLVIDDNAMNQQVARELLQHEGARVSVASRGAEGLTMAIEAQPGFDAVLLDIQMPEMDGYACARAMRAHRHLQDTPIIAMTANVMASEREACRAAGMDGHLAKPIDAQALVEILDAHCHAALELARQPDQGGYIAFAPALERLAGNRALYLTLAAAFAGEANAFLVALGEYLRDSARVPALALLHTFKSVAGIVGAQALQEACAARERDWRDPQAPFTSEPFMQELQRLVHASIAELDQIARELRATAEPASAPGVTLPLPGMLDELMSLLQGSNMHALAVMAQIEAMHGKLLGERLRPLAANVARLDFPAARRDCLLLRSELT